MSRESDLLFGLLALQMNFVSKEHLLECAAVWMGDPGAGLPGMLLARKFIRPSQHAAIGALVEEQLKAQGGDAGKSLLTVVLDRDVRDGLLALGPSGEVGRSLSAMRPREGGGPKVIVAPPAGDRYRLGAEIARGGLGRVVEAFDATLGREVAVKLVLDDLPPALADRFEREAKLTARLDHPHIVPVYDFGAIGGDLFLSMKRIRGRDLGKLLKAIAAGDAEVRRTYTRARLLRVFQDICLGMAFAHDRGVIHRDLKPANVMIGDYGETLIVDWGLARVAGEAAGGTAGAAPAAPSGTDLTMDGEILGTPAYMPPEQAAGQLNEMDRRSDIYSLGAILYEILTLHPPFEGKTAQEILGKVRGGRITPPSNLVEGAADPERTAFRAPSTRIAADPVPPELDAICLRAMAFRRDDRTPSAAELHDEVQLFLEGVKERERRRKEAREGVERGKAHFARYRALQEEIAAQDKAVAELGKVFRPHMAPEKKRPLWDAQACLRSLREARIEAYTKASAEFGQALVVDPSSAEAADWRCELVLDRFLDAEKKRDREEMLLNRSVLLQYDRDGRYRAKLDAPGTLALRAFAYGCDCLRPVRHPEWRVEIAEATTIPWRDGRPRPDLPLEVKDRPVPAVRTFPAGLHWGHTDACPRRELRGVEVRVAKYEERDRRLVLGPERVLGTTPLEGVELPQGSWRCTLRSPDPAFAEAHLPVLISRGGRWEQDVTVHRAADIPPGFRPVPGGPFTFGGAWAGGDEPQTKRTEDLFVATFPVTCAEYADFLDDLAASGRADEARRRQPRQGDKKWWVEKDGRFRLPAGSGDAKMDWDARWPVFGVDWFDSIAYAAWRAKLDGIPYRLMHEEEYEKSARGVDGRIYSYGDTYDGTYAHTNVSVPEKMTPMPVGSFPVDESPWGVRDLSGGMETWCWNSPEDPYRDFRSARGGAWSQTSVDASSARRHGNHPTGVSLYFGIRLAVSAVADRGGNAKAP